MRILLLLACAITVWSAERNDDWYRGHYAVLAERAATASLPLLYYPEDTFTPNHNALIRVRDPLIQGVLAARFAAERDERRKWNLLMLLINRIEKGHTGDDEGPVLAACLRGLTAKDEWLKTESVWGVGLFGNASHIPAVEEAGHDLSDVVADEAGRTIAKLRLRPVQ